MAKKKEFNAQSPVKVAWLTASFDDDGNFELVPCSQEYDTFAQANAAVEMLQYEGCNYSVRIQ